nr:response regulator transcription factor [Paraburkholderia tropica]
MAERVRVIVADDHECVRIGVIGLLRASPRMQVVAEASDTHSLACQLDAHACDVVVSDVCMPGMDGEYGSLSMLRRLVRAPHAPAVVVLTMISSAPMLSGLLHHGLRAIVDKRDMPHALLPAIDAARGRMPFQSACTRAALDRAGADCEPCIGVPSAREWEVLRLYVHGMPIGAIARQLGRSVKTVSTQKRNAMRKFGLATERELIDFATQIGLT